MSQLAIDFTTTAAVTPLQAAVDRWLMANAEEIHGFEGELSANDDGSANLDGWLPAYNSGVYIIGEYACDTFNCEGCGVTPFGYRSCTPRIKIGRAKDVYTRLAGIKTGSSRGMDVLALMPFADQGKAERELHHLFASQRIVLGRKTEWFWHSAELESLIVEVVSYGAEYSSPR